MYADEVLSGKCFHLVLPSESKNEGMESFLYGVGSVVLLSVLMAKGKRDLAVEDEVIRVRFVEEEKKELEALKKDIDDIYEEEVAVRGRREA